MIFFYLFMLDASSLHENENNILFVDPKITSDIKICRSGIVNVEKGGNVSKDNNQACVGIKSRGSNFRKLLEEFRNNPNDENKEKLEELGISSDTIDLLLLKRLTLNSIVSESIKKQENKKNDLDVKNTKVPGSKNKNSNKLQNRLLGSRGNLKKKDKLMRECDINLKKTNSDANKLSYKAENNDLFITEYGNYTDTAGFFKRERNTEAKFPIIQQFYPLWFSKPINSKIDTEYKKDDLSSINRIEINVNVDKGKNRLAANVQKCPGSFKCSDISSEKKVDSNELQREFCLDYIPIRHYRIRDKDLVRSMIEQECLTVLEPDNVSESLEAIKILSENGHAVDICLNNVEMKESLEDNNTPEDKFEVFHPKKRRGNKRIDQDKPEYGIIKEIKDEQQGMLDNRETKTIDQDNAEYSITKETEIVKQGVKRNVKNKENEHLREKSPVKQEVINTNRNKVSSRRKRKNLAGRKKALENINLDHNFCKSNEKNEPDNKINSVRDSEPETTGSNMSTDLNVSKDTRDIDLIHFEEDEQGKNCENIEVDVCDSTYIRSRSNNNIKEITEVNNKLNDSNLNKNDLELIEDGKNKCLCMNSNECFTLNLQSVNKEYMQVSIDGGLGNPEDVFDVQVINKDGRHVNMVRDLNHSIKTFNIQVISKDNEHMVRDSNNSEKTLNIQVIGKDDEHRVGDLNNTEDELNSQAIGKDGAQLVRNLNIIEKEALNIQVINKDDEHRVGDLNNTEDTLNLQAIGKDGSQLVKALNNIEKEALRIQAIGKDGGHMNMVNDFSNQNLGIQNNYMSCASNTGNTVHDHQTMSSSQTFSNPNQNPLTIFPPFFESMMVNDPRSHQYFVEHHNAANMFGYTSNNNSMSYFIRIKNQCPNCLGTDPLGLHLNIFPQTGMISLGVVKTSEH